LENISVTPLRKLGELAREKEVVTNARMFAHVAKWIALCKGSPSEAYNLAKMNRALPPILSVLKSATDPGSTTGWGSSLAEFSVLADAFLVSLRSASIFEAALPFTMRVPPMTTVRIVTTGATGATINEAMTKPVTKLALSASDMNEQKSVAIVAATESLLRQSNIRLFQTELESAVAAAVDAAFITKITTGISPTATNGYTSTAVLQDISSAIRSLTLDASSKVFIAVSPDIAAAWATKVTAQGELLLPDLGIGGGEVAGCTVFPCDCISGQVVAFDAAQIATSDGGIELDTAKYATLQLDTVGDSPPSSATPYISLWQMDMVGLKAIRHWAAERLRTGECNFRRQLHRGFAVMNVTALQRPPKHDHRELIDLFSSLSRSYGGDIGALIAGELIELQETINALEERIARLEATKKR
jgi:Phage capsid family